MARCLRLVRDITSIETKARSQSSLRMKWAFRQSRRVIVGPVLTFHGGDE